MATGQKTVKVKFDGSTKGLSAAARVAQRVMRSWSKQTDKVRKKAEAWSNSDSAAKKWAGRAASALAGLMGVASKVGSGIMSGISGAVSAAGPVVKGALVAVLATAAAAAAPVIAAAISSGVMLGLGGGVIAGGIALVAKSPKVKTAAENLKNRFLDIDTADLEENYKAAQERMSQATGREAKKRAAAELREAKKALDEATAYNKKNFSLRDAAAPFIEPVTRALETFQKAAGRVMPVFADMFEKMAPHIDKLAPALASMAEKALPGIAAAVERAGPLFDKLAEVLPQFGVYISQFFDNISANAPQSAQFLGDMVNILGIGLATLGMWIGWLTKFYSWARTVWIGFGGLVRSAILTVLDALDWVVTGAAKAFGWIPGLGPKLTKAANEFEVFRNKVNKALNGIHDKTVGVNVAVRVTGYKGKNTSAVAHALRKQGYATGGWARGMYLAGENGPELIAAGSGGNNPDRVYSNRETKSMMQPEVRVYVGTEELDARTARVAGRMQRRQTWRARVGRR
ncbi:hypothetical protein O7626_31375 [Micromonospora sp. WMMD1102]|uniref:hypothetical protein n=1 Tax=Micromonospora sp. WMMD1102 TaxID=3016105 RepID=UPI0024151A17|nr:hypothetical protein [Micromonospora sp. WMMD1102]MDG4790370.1 hypothetical protein [Micromonospora sp. WMMD1102]